MPHRKWFYNMDNLNSGMDLSQDFSGYLDNITPDSSDASLHFDNPLSFPWSCEGGGCNCASIDTMSAIQPTARTASVPSSTVSCVSTEGNSYIDYSLPSPTNTTAIAAQQIKEGLCPLATGATNECVPQLCGANPPCQAFWTVPEIEECGDVPCLVSPDAQSSQSQPLRETIPPRNLSSSPSPWKRTRRESDEKSLTMSKEFLTNPGINSKDSNTTHPSPKHDKKPKGKPADPKQAHSLVEKRYRENLNAKITELHTVLAAAPDGTPSPESCQTRKSEVLQTAIDYVNQSQLEMRHMTNDINRLNAKVKQLERLVKCEDCSLSKGFDGLRVLAGQGSSGMNGVGASYGMAATSAG
jgi:hypothetical protein